MSSPLISVVVPFFNNAALLGPCLASIAAQSVTDLQVIMVDDGSGDGSGEVARERAAADPRFVLVTQPNAGPGAARNRGVGAAAGEFLAFADADDLLPPAAYETMLAVLRESGSDFVSGAVRRLEAGGQAESGLHARAIRQRRLATHISRAPELFYDISVWNKLFRRSFWDSAGMTLPEGMLWEDLVAMTRAHVLARAVDVITEPVYLWRDRDQGAPSITQSRTDIANFRDRITALELIDRFLGEGAGPAMLRAHQRKALVNDIWLYVRDLPATSPGYRGEFVALAGRYLATVPPGVVAGQPSTRRLAYHLIAAGREGELTAYARWLAGQPGRTPPMTRTWRGLVADLPYREHRELAVPASVYRPRWRELDPYVRIDNIYWENGRLVVLGSAYVPSVDIGNRRLTTKLVVLAHRGGPRPPIVVRARPVLRPDITAVSGQDRYSYDWAGFRCEIGPAAFRWGGKWLAGEWDCFIAVRGRRVWRPARLHGPGPGVADVEARPIARGITLAAVWSGPRLRLVVGP